MKTVTIKIYGIEDTELKMETDSTTVHSNNAIPLKRLGLVNAEGAFELVIDLETNKVINIKAINSKS